MQSCSARAFTFDIQGTRFHLFAVLCEDVGVVLALPDFAWSMSVSTHEAPSVDYLRSKKACGGNRVDQRNLASWLAVNWLKVVA